MLVTIGAEKYYSSHPILKAKETSNNVVRKNKLKF
jgi:hypothetical protein